MKIDTEKIQRYLLEIKARHYEIEELLRENSDPEILEKPWVCSSPWSGKKKTIFFPL